MHSFYFLLSILGIQVSFCMHRFHRQLWAMPPRWPSNLFPIMPTLIQSVKYGHLVSALQGSYHPHCFQGAQFHNSISYCQFQLTEDSFSWVLVPSHQDIHYQLVKKSILQTLLRTMIRSQSRSWSSFVQ